MAFTCTGSEDYGCRLAMYNSHNSSLLPTTTLAGLTRVGTHQKASLGFVVTGATAQQRRRRHHLAYTGAW